MSSRAIVSGELHRALKRGRTKASGALYGVATIRDRDRLESRFWSAFVWDVELIERFEKLAVGEPVAVAGPFSVVSAGTQDNPRVEHRVTAHEMIDTRIKRKSKRQIKAEEREVSDEADDAPRDGGAPFDDSLPF